jgi:hypothetical protein
MRRSEPDLVVVPAYNETPVTASAQRAASMIAQVGLTLLLLWVMIYAWAEYRRRPVIGTIAVVVAAAE